MFGQSLILSAFNYAKGRVYGVEFTGSYNQGGFSAYANLAWSQAQGEGLGIRRNSCLIRPTLAYVQNHWIYLDHDQRVTGSFGVSYTWHEGSHYSTQLYADAIYGSGLRTDDAAAPFPTARACRQYYSINLGAAQSFKLPHNQTLVARLDVVNLTDNIYQLRDGSGVGVNAAQYGERLGFFGSLSLTF